MNYNLVTLIKEAGLTEGEAKVYLALLKIGQATVGPVVKESKVANSIVYRILESLIKKGLASYITKEKTKFYSAAEPNKLVEYLDEKKEKIEDSKEKIIDMVPNLLALSTIKEKTSVQIYEGFKGIQTAYEHYYLKLKKGDKFYCWGVHPFQEERYHLYWQKDHVRRAKLGIKVDMMMNKGTDPEILRNRNSYKGCDTRYMSSNMKTPAWFMVYKDVSVIFLQNKKPVAVEIINQEIADSFKAYYDDLWKRSKPFRS